MLDFAIYIGSTPTFLYYDLYYYYIDKDWTVLGILKCINFAWF